MYMCVLDPLCVCIILYVGARVRVSAVWTWGPGHVQKLNLVDNTGKITKGLFFYRHKTRTIWTHIAVRLTFLITKFNKSNLGHSKLWLLLKYLFVKSKKNSLPLCTLMPDSRPSFGFAIFAWISSISGLKVLWNIIFLSLYAIKYAYWNIYSHL